MNATWERSKHSEECVKARALKPWTNANSAGLWMQEVDPYVTLKQVEQTSQEATFT